MAIKKIKAVCTSKKARDKTYENIKMLENYRKRLINKRK